MQQAVPTVWMITDRATGEPSYVHTDDGSDNRVIGPFAYTSENDAREAARTRSFLPASIGPVELEATEIEGMGFITGILTRFEPSNTDVVVLDEGMFPLSESGAYWVDDTTGRDHWKGLFGGKPTDWMDAILEQVSERLGVEVVRVNEPVEEMPTKAAQAHAKVRKNVAVHMEPEQGALFGEMSPKATFRVYTTGMESLDRPDLEMTGITPLFVGDAQHLLLGWAAYSLDHKLEPGASLMGATDPLTIILKVEDADGRIRLVVEQVLYASPMMSKMVH